MRLIAAGGILAAGLYLGSQFRGAGIGGEGVGVDPPSGEPAAETVETPEPGVDPAVDLPPQSEPPVSEELADGTIDEPAGPPAVIDVVIGADAYEVRRDGGEPELMTVEEVAELAATTTGTENGVRVRLSEGPTARVADLENLRRELAGAGVAMDAVQQPVD